MTTSDKLREAARILGWKYQGITANHGKIRQDYFANGPTLIVVTYDARGRAFQIQKQHRDRQHELDEHHGVGKAGKVKIVIGWMRAESE